MEEKEKNQEPQKLSYEQLKANFDELLSQYNKLMANYREAVNQINQMDYTQFFLGMLFRVMEHPNRYSDKFVHWCTENIEGAVTAFASYRDNPEGDDKDKADKK